MATGKLAAGAGGKRGAKATAKSARAEKGAAGKGGAGRSARSGKSSGVATIGRGGASVLAGAVTPKPVPREVRDELFGVLRARFETHMSRHRGIDWADVQARLEAKPAKVWSLAEMERTGGEPDVVGRDKTSGEYVFADCSAQSPAGRRSLCYDREAWESRKEARPASSAMEVAAAMGVEMLTPDRYRALQSLGEFDTTTSSWVVTPPEIRRLGGAMFGDRRYGVVWLYHNGAESYYAARGFRASVRV